MIFDVIEVASGATVASVAGAVEAGIVVGSTIDTGMGVLVGLAAPLQAVNSTAQTSVNAARCRFRMSLPRKSKSDLHYF